MNNADHQPELGTKIGDRDESSGKRIDCLGDFVICELEARDDIARDTGNLDQLWQLITALQSLLDLAANTYAFHGYKNGRNEEGGRQ